MINTWGLSPNMSDIDFEDFKKYILKYALSRNACKDGIEKHNESKNPQEWLNNCGQYFYWLGVKAPKLKGFAHCDGDLNLYGYKHRLPETFTYCGGDLILEGGYQFELPKNLIVEGKIYR